MAVWNQSLILIFKAVLAKNHQAIDRQEYWQRPFFKSLFFL
jgi:hypothetical protein